MSGTLTGSSVIAVPILQSGQRFPRIHFTLATQAGRANLEKEMSEDRKNTEQRRRFLKLVGGGAVLMPIMGLSACSGGDDKSPAMDAPKAAEDAAPAKPSGMPQLSEDDPQAKSLGYVHDAASIDGAKQPRFKAGQACSNCALYQGKADAAWAGCSIFPGKAVAGAGWCTVYAPKPG